MRHGDLITKDPDSVEPYGFDWTSYLADFGAEAEIDTSEWIITPLNGESPSTLTIDDESIEAGNLKTQAYFTGGTQGAIYRVTNRIVTNTAVTVTDDRSVTMKVAHK